MNVLFKFIEVVKVSVLEINVLLFFDNFKCYV